MKASKLEQFVAIDSPENKKEPALNVAMTGTSVAAAIVLILTFVFPNMSEELKNAILALISILLPLLVGILTRRKVWSPASVDKLMEEYGSEREEAIRKMLAAEKPFNKGFKEPDGRKF